MNLMRILRIFKMSPYKPPGPCHIRVSKLAVPLEMFVITAGFNSVDIQPVFTDSTTDNRVLLGVCFGGLLLFGLIALCVSGPAVCVGSSVLCVIGPCRNRWAFFNRGTKPLLVVLLLQFAITAQSACILIFLRIPFFIALVLFPVRILLLLAFGVTLCLVKCGYLRQKVFLLPWVILDIALSFPILGNILKNEKELPVWMCFYAFLYVLTATVACQHNTDDYDDVEWDIAHILVYVFGSTLSVINSVALATEVFLKAGEYSKNILHLNENICGDCPLGDVRSVWIQWLQKVFKVCIPFLHTLLCCRYSFKWIKLPKIDKNL
ncbi:uncharacterized protein LOC133141375 [Conger conger]|uniref:uncharacterized protein LOC133105661 n=1 Tax=Conger conger TaxID=82655 RepID=UPI002A5A6C82|nr:uncharacterized protein LOC133105661 [Conger conger]XP_061117884.1 uncharacterized protein LOC133141375 [Conger conger]